MPGNSQALSGDAFYTNTGASSCIPSAVRALHRYHRIRCLLAMAFLCISASDCDVWVGDVSTHRHQLRAMSSWFRVCPISRFARHPNSWLSKSFTLISLNKKLGVVNNRGLCSERRDTRSGARLRAPTNYTLTRAVCCVTSRAQAIDPISI